MQHLYITITFLAVLTSYPVFSQTPNNCGNYTSVGSNGASGYADPNTVCGANVPCTITGGAAAWTGFGCTGTITSTVVGGPVSCIVLSFGAVNTDDYATITTDTGGLLTFTVVNAGVSGNVIGPYNCGSGFYGNVEVTISSTIPFNTITITNTGCSSGWVINCADQSGCGGGQAGADDLTPQICSGSVDLDTLVTGDPGGIWIETTVPVSGAFNTGTAIFDGDVAGPGIYTFSYVFAGGCSGGDTAYFQVEVLPPSDAAWTVPSNLCQNSGLIDLSTFITGVPGGVWSGTGISGSIFDPSVGTQTITYTSGTAPCDDVVSQSIPVINSMDPGWNSPGTICEAAGPINLDALLTGDIGGTWSGTGVSGNTFNPTGLSGAISVTYTIGTTPCIGIDQQTITVLPDVDPSWTPPTTLCNDSPQFDLNTTITGTLGGTWSGTGVTANTFNPAMGSQTVTYSVGTAPCVETMALMINVGTTPNPAWTTFTMCASDAPVNMNTTVTGTTGGNWSGTGISGSVFDPFFGTQNITYTVVNGSCSASSSQAVTVVDPQLTTSVTNVTCYGLSDGSANVMVTGGSGAYNYSWSTTPAQTTSTASNIPAGTYTVTVTDGSCVVTSNVTVIEPDSLFAVLTAVNRCTPYLGSATANPYGGVGGYTYDWDTTSQTTSTATDLDSAMHTVTITDNNGCTYTDSILVQIFPLPTISVTPDTTIAYGDQIYLNATGGISYLWNPDTDLDCNTCPNPKANPLQDTYYCVTGIDTNGCSNEDCILLEVVIVCGDIFVPSAFSPNDDGENDALCVYSDCMESMIFAIYNRWGEKVFENSTLNICWDGTWNGKILNPAVYAYTLNGYLINGESIEQKGNISLIR